MDGSALNCRRGAEMIDSVRLLWAGSHPDMNSSECVHLLREVARTQSWVRYSFLLIGLALMVGVGLLIVLVSAPERVLRMLLLPSLPGKITAPGWVVLTILCGLGVGSLFLYWTLREDILPYSLGEDILRRYTVREGRITDFGSWTTFGSRLSRFERIYWRIEGTTPLQGRTPYVRAALSAWLDYDDPVWVGVDPRNEQPPIFLGVGKPPPEILVRGPAPGAQEIFRALEEHFKTSRRWKGKRFVGLWGFEKRL
jgi:hypothetical protein